MLSCLHGSCRVGINVRNRRHPGYVGRRAAGHERGCDDQCEGKECKDDAETWLEASPNEEKSGDQSDQSASGIGLHNSYEDCEYRREPPKLSDPRSGGTEQGNTEGKDD